MVEKVERVSEYLKLISFDIDLHEVQSFQVQLGGKRCQLANRHLHTLGRNMPKAGIVRETCCAVSIPDRALDNGYVLEIVMNDVLLQCAATVGAGSIETTRPRGTYCESRRLFMPIFAPMSAQTKSSCTSSRLRRANPGSKLSSILAKYRSVALIPADVEALRADSDALVGEAMKVAAFRCAGAAVMPHQC